MRKFSIKYKIRCERIILEKSNNLLTIVYFSHREDGERFECIIEFEFEPNDLLLEKLFGYMRTSHMPRRMCYIEDVDIFFRSRRFDIKEFMFKDGSEHVYQTCSPHFHIDKVKHGSSVMNNPKTIS